MISFIEFTGQKDFKFFALLSIQVLVITLVVGGGIYYVNRYRQNTENQATEESVSLRLSPVEIQTELDQSVSITPILLSETKPVGYTHVTIVYNLNHLSLTGVEPIQSDTRLILLDEPDIAKANQTGRLVLILGALDPKDPPLGSIQLPTIVFTPISESQSVVNMDQNATQVVYLDNQTDAIIEVGETAVSTVPLPSPVASKSADITE